MARARKIMMLGQMAVGKTSLANRMEFGSFDTNYKSTIGVELHSFDFECDGETESLVLWDTDGSFGDRIFESVYLKGASAALIVADVTRPGTIDAMINLSRDFEDVLPGRPSCCLLNKSDLRQVTGDQKALLSKDTDFLQVCSAKTGEGVFEALTLLCRTLRDREDNPDE